MSFCKLLKEAIVDERKGASDYQTLIDKARKEGIPEATITMISKIMGDEHRHKTKLQYKYKQFCK